MQNQTVQGELCQNPKMELWEQVSSTDPKYTKSVNQRGGFTAIDAYYQIRQATILWGPYGSTWGLKDTERDICLDMEMAFLDATFYYPGGEFPIGNSIDMKIGGKVDKWDDEFVKKLETNTISKALSRLGFGADVFLGKFDDARYVLEQNEKYGNPIPKAPAPPGMAAAAPSAPAPAGIPAAPGQPGTPPPPPPVKR